MRILDGKRHWRSKTCHIVEKGRKAISKHWYYSSVLFLLGKLISVTFTGCLTSWKTSKDNRGMKKWTMTQRVRKGVPDEKIPSLHDGSPVGAGFTSLCFRRRFQHRD